MSMPQVSAITELHILLANAIPELQFLVSSGEDRVLTAHLVPEEAAMTLDPGQVKSALEGLQGWQVEDGALIRGVPVTDDSRQALVEAVANASADSPSSPEVHLQPDLVVVRIGEPTRHGVTPDDVELAARIDQVLAGSLRDHGSADSDA